MKTRFTCHGDGRRPPRPHGGTCCWNRETTDVWFAIRGANLNLDEQGNVESVWDAAFLIDVYLDLCRKGGHPRPAVIGL